MFSGDIRVTVRGSDGGEVRVMILELSSTSSRFSDPIITSCEVRGVHELRSTDELFVTLMSSNSAAFDRIR